MSQFPQMIYKTGGTEEIHGGHFATLIVQDADELAAALADGWALTTTEATEAGSQVPSDNAAPTRAELEQKANELGVEFSPRLGDAKLAERIEDKLKEQA